MHLNAYFVLCLTTIMNGFRGVSFRREALSDSRVRKYLSKHRTWVVAPKVIKTAPGPEDQNSSMLFCSDFVAALIVLPILISFHTMRFWNKIAPMVLLLSILLIVYQLTLDYLVKFQRTLVACVRITWLFHVKHFWYSYARRAVSMLPWQRPCSTSMPLKECTCVKWIDNTCTCSFSVVDSRNFKLNQTVDAM